MPRYLIELTHEDDHVACVQALDAIQRYGAHIFTNAEWGCKVGVHCGWLIVELDSEREAMQLVPPEFRDSARIVEIERFSREYVMSLKRKYDV